MQSKPLKLVIVERPSRYDIAHGCDIQMKYRAIIPLTPDSANTVRNTEGS